MRNELWLGLLVSGLAQMPCWAETHAATHEETHAERLTRIEAETAVLKARDRNMDVQAHIVSRQAEIEGKHAEIAGKRAEARRIAQASTGGTPTLRGIDGLGSTLYATLELPRYGLLDVRSGDTLPDGTRVDSVSAKEVVLKGPGKQVTRLSGIAAAPPTATPQPAPLGANFDSLPPLPPPPMLPPTVPGVRK